jgi:signal transduction histidine kinase
VVTHADPAKVELANELHKRFPANPNNDRGAYHIARTGQSLLVAEVTDAMISEMVPDPELLRIIRELSLSSYIGVPLSVRGKTIGVITFIRAESGQHYSATDLAVAEDLAHRTAIAMENAQLYSEAQQADRRKDEFLATLAHELRNPLAPLRNGLEIMKGPSASPQSLQAIRDMMERQVLHMTRMVDDLLDVSRITRGKIELRKEIVDVATVLTRAVEAVSPMLKENRHKFSVTLPSTPLRVNVDPTRFEQIVTNLLQNAIKYTDAGGHVCLTARRKDDQLEMTIKDNGIGIASDLLSHVFEPFVQSRQQSNRSQSGLGIGLALVRNLVEMHQGSVHAASAGVGQGSEFTVLLPLAPPEEAKSGDADSGLKPSKNHSSRRHILVVDDNVDAADSMAMLLELQGHEVRVAHDGHAALAAVKTAAPEIIFLDIGMPGMNGYEVARTLRQHSELGKLVLIAMTGWGQDVDRRRSQEAGFDHHLVKPADPQMLQGLLQKGDAG